MSDSLYKLIGEKPAVESLVKLFYAKITADDSLSKYFEKVDIKKLIDHQIRFISEVLGGPTVSWPKIELKKSHENLNINDADYDKVVDHLKSSLNELNVKEEYTNIIMNKVESLRSIIVTNP